MRQELPNYITVVHIRAQQGQAGQEEDEGDHDEEEERADKTMTQK
jgi:hypothetical protein